jgi:hypothetical protein
MQTEILLMETLTIECMVEIIGKQIRITTQTTIGHLNFAERSSSLDL